MICHRFTTLLAASVLLIASAGCTSQADDKNNEPPRTMTVAGHGEARHAPDMSTISAGVRTQGQTAQEALRANTGAMSAVFDAMKKLGIAEADMQTSDFSVQPIYQDQPANLPQTGPAKIIGYQVFNQVTVTVRDLTKLGAALDTFVTAGANEMYGVSFGIADTSSLLDEARTAAVKDAMHKANLMTGAAGVKLGRLMSMSESSDIRPMPVNAMRVEMKASAPVPTAAGEQVLSADASLTYELE